FDVNPVYTFRNFPGPMEKLGRQICGFAVEINDVGNEMSLLQQIRAARKIRPPGLCLFRPGFITCEPLTEWTERESGFAIEKRLMYRGVNHKTIKAVRHFLIGGWL